MKRIENNRLFFFNDIFGWFGLLNRINVLYLEVEQQKLNWPNRSHHMERYGIFCIFLTNSLLPEYNVIINTFYFRHVLAWNSMLLRSLLRHLKPFPGHWQKTPGLRPMK